MKVCRICNVEKDLSSFHKKTSNKDGYNSECKQCRHIRYVNKKKNVYVEEQKKKEHTMFIALMVIVITIALIGITR